MRYLVNNSVDPYFNLAFDEYCLERFPSDGDFFYLWRNRPSVIIGLNQNAYSEVNLAYLDSHDITLARRVTGGGAVYHDLQNLNYTIVGGAVTPQPIVNALRSLGLNAEMTGRNDIFIDGRKVSGYARRVWHDRQIIHGTLLYDVDLDTLTRVLDVSGSKMEAKGIASVKSRVANLKGYLPGYPTLDTLQAKLQEIVSAGDPQLEMPQSELDEIARIASGKFATWEWVYGQSKEADVEHRAKFPCGTVEVRISLSRGIITDIAFGGDFLFDKPSTELATRLDGVRFDKKSVSGALEGLQMSRYFPGVTTGQLTDLIINQ